MNLNLRMVAAMALGVLCVLGAMILNGGHASELLAAESLLVVGSIAIGGLVALRGPRVTGQVLRAAFIKNGDEQPERDELIAAVEVLEHTTLLGGFVGLMGGATMAVSHFHQPELIGPSIHFGFTSLLYCLFGCAFVALPLKQQLLREVDPDLRLAPQAALRRALTMGAWVLLVVGMLSTGLFANAAFHTVVCWSSGLFLLAALVPSWLVARDPYFVSPVSENRQVWYSNALVCIGVVAVCVSMVHAMSVLDQPALLPPGIAWAMGTLALPVAAAVLMRLQQPHPKLRMLDARGLGSRNLYFGFAAVALLVVFGQLLLVYLCLENLVAAESAPPR